MFALYGEVSEEELLTQCNPKLYKTYKRKTSEGYIEYYNIACSFDLEASSFYDNEEKRGIMYAFGICINGYVCIGRSWSDFVRLIHEISERLQTNEEKRLILYVHNLSYDFQWFHKWLNLTKVFAIDERKVCYAIDETGIEFRCSYLLSGYSLDALSKQLNTYKVSKLVGDLDYAVLRTPITPITQKERQYLINDCLVNAAYVQEKIEIDGGIHRLPLTKTGYVRKYIRKKCLKFPKNAMEIEKKRVWVFKDQIKRTVPLTVKEYRLAKLAFAGGFTHSNAKYNGDVIENVTSIDFTSSYPAVLVAERYPMGPGREIEVEKLNYEDFTFYIDNFCCLMMIEINDITSKTTNDHYISVSKCITISDDYVRDNGRLVSASKIVVPITDVDWNIIKHVYKFRNFRVHTMFVYGRGYLPTAFIDALLDLYIQKTTLKGVEGKEVEYLVSKENLNSFYGMCVTAIDRLTQIYEDKQWKEPQEPVLSEVIDKYNNNQYRFLSYLWGVWCTAYARQNLWTMIINCGDDYIYADTDSGKIKNFDKHKEYVEKYNILITDKIKHALEEHKIPYSKACPKTIKGIEKPLGVWDFDGLYKRFKTLGAKRYLVQYDNDEYSLTCAGVNKRKGAEYLQTLGDPFDFFTDKLTFPKGTTGKLIHTYIDCDYEGDVLDFEGRPYHYYEKSCVHLEESEYSLTIEATYKDYIAQLLGYRKYL